MKYINSFKNLQSGPKIGDYVLIKTLSSDTDFRDFITNNVGQISDIDTRFMSKNIIVTYKFVPEKLKEWMTKTYNSDINTRSFRFSQIEHFSSKKEDIEEIIAAKKYNL